MNLLDALSPTPQRTMMGNPHFKIAEGFPGTACVPVLQCVLHTILGMTDPQAAQPFTTHQQTWIGSGVTGAEHWCEHSQTAIPIVQDWTMHYVWCV